MSYDYDLENPIVEGDEGEAGEEVVEGEQGTDHQ